MKKKLAIVVCNIVVGAFFLQGNQFVKADTTQEEQVQKQNVDIQASSNSLKSEVNTVKIIYNGPGKVAVWDNYTSDRKITGKYLDKNTRWKSYQVGNNGQEDWYNLGGNQWVSSEYAKKENATSNQPSDQSKYQVVSKNQNVTINYSGKGKVAVWSSYDNSKKVTGNYLSNGTSWKSFLIATGNGKTWYNLGGNQWIDGQYIRTTPISGTNSGNTSGQASGLTYLAGQKKYVFYKNGEVQKGRIISGKQTFYTDPYGGIYRVENNIPVISQLPELPTGCEMTAVTMMLQGAGVNVSKTQVADETPRASNGDKGFIGNPYKVTGWYVYPKGIAPVVRKHLGTSQDMTGASVSAIQDKLMRGHSVVVWMANMNGFVNHSITLTGYSATGNYYYNNPWTGKKETMSEKYFLQHWTANKKRALSY